MRLDRHHHDGVGEVGPVVTGAAGSQPISANSAGNDARSSPMRWKNDWNGAPSSPNDSVVSNARSSIFVKQGKVSARLDAMK